MPAGPPTGLEDSVTSTRMPRRPAPAGRSQSAGSPRPEASSTPAARRGHAWWSARPTVRWRRATPPASSASPVHTLADLTDVVVKHGGSRSRPTTPTAPTLLRWRVDPNGLVQLDHPVASAPVRRRGNRDTAALVRSLHAGLAAAPSVQAVEKTGSPMMAAPATPRRSVTTRPPQALAAPVDGRRLATELAANLRGEVRFDPGSRALYAKDYSVYRHLPIGVVVPRDVDDVVATVELCRRHGAPVLARGCGTSPNGQCCNVAVVIDCSKYLRRIVALDPERRVARVQPGVVCDQLRTAAERHQLTFGPDPATHAYNTLGGMIGNNSCGTHSVMAGQTVDNIHELEVLTYDGLRLRVGPTSEEELERTIAQGGRRGEIYARLRDLRDRYGELVRQRYPRIPRRCSGYNLDQLLPERGFHVARALVGSESTCVTLLEATTRLVPSPQHRRTVVLGYPDRFAAGDHVPAIMAHGPIGLEGFDTTLTDNMQASGALAVERSALPPGQAWLLVEFGADSEEGAAERASAAARELEAGGGPLSVKLCDAGEQLAVWAVRQAGVD